MCAHRRVLQSWYLMNTQTASQLAGATFAFQLFSHEILNVISLPETDVPVISTLFALLLNANKKIIADDFETIQLEARQLVEAGYQLILFTGGTGLSSRDVTPDAIRPLLEREVPGVMEVARDYGQQRTPYAMLSRGIAGFVGESLIITLPGSPRGAEESMQAIFPYILHVFRVKEGVKH